MLRLSHDRLRVSLTPTEVSWLKFAGAIKPRVVAKRRIAVDAAFGAKPWHGTVAALRSEADGWRRDPVRVTIVLSNHFARYVVVSSSEGVNGTDEEQALARFYLAKVHGERARTWEVRLGNAASGAPRVACAIDAGLLEALRTCFPAKESPKLVSVQPLLMSVFNFSRRRLPKTGAWLLLVEPQRACLALLAEQSCMAVQNAKGDFSNTAAWVDLLERERWKVDADHIPNTVFVHAPGFSSATLPRGGAWNLVGLQHVWPAGLEPLADSMFASALTVS